MGFLFLAFQPCLYCNVNDAWLFEHKRHKIYVALAGVWVELLLSAIAAFIWLIVDISNPIGFIAFVLMTIGTASSLFINLNPLLKFDGYYILTDWLEIQNLRQNAIAWFSWTIKHHLLNSSAEVPSKPSPREKRIYLWYGALTTLYMAMIFAVIGLIGYDFISSHFGFFATSGFIIFFALVIKKFTGTWSEEIHCWYKQFFWGSGKKKRNSLMGAFLFAIILIFWPPHMRINANGIVEANQFTLYAPENGFISYVGYNQQRNILSANETTIADTVTLSGKRKVLSLSAPLLNLTKQQLDAEQEQLKLKQQIALSSNEQGQTRQLAIQYALVLEKLAQINIQLSKLDIFAPSGQWQVEGLPPSVMQGRFYAKNSEILTLVSARNRYMDVIVDQRDVYLLKIGHQARIQLTGAASGIFHAAITTIAPIATLDGLEQSFKIRMQIIPDSNLLLPPLGLSGEVLIFGERQSLWRHIFHEIRKVLRADLWL